MRRVCAARMAHHVAHARLRHVQAEAKALAKQRKVEQDRVFKADPVSEVVAVADEGPGALPWFIISAEWLNQWNVFIYNGSCARLPARCLSRRGSRAHRWRYACGVVCRGAVERWQWSWHATAWTGVQPPAPRRRWSPSARTCQSHALPRRQQAGTWLPCVCVCVWPCVCGRVCVAVCVWPCVWPCVCGLVCVVVEGQAVRSQSCFGNAALS